MTTKKELAEMILESEMIGSPLQKRQHGHRTWEPSLDGIYNINAFEYRLAPKGIKHSGWFDVDFLAKHSSPVPLISGTCVNFEWETEE